MTHPRRRRRGAFTLVELLVVIGIIALLISILLPTLSAARRQGDLVKCASNLRQLGLAMQMYGQQYDGHLPGSYMQPETYTLNDAGLPGGSMSVTGGGVYWWQRLEIERLLPGAGSPSKSAAVCPSDQNNFEPFNQGNGSPALALMCNCSYAINNYLTMQCNDTTARPIVDAYTPVAPGSLRRVTWPKALTATRAADKILLVDVWYGYSIDWTDPNTIPNLSVNAYPWNNQIDWRRHSSSKVRAGTTNVLYLDGHVAPARQNPNGSNLSDQPNVVNDINGTDYHLGAAVNAKMVFQSQPY
jgi:prepilin-type N-terminal cleavage/methylation domain-containing protein/prepilin-type processing-associated H-X9-DG protein